MSYSVNHLHSVAVKSIFVEKNWYLFLIHAFNRYAAEDNNVHLTIVIVDLFFFINPCHAE